jgi:hypothetical protein
MKRCITIASLTGLLLSPGVFAEAPEIDLESFELSRYETVAVQPVLAASSTPGVFERLMAADAGQLRVDSEQVAAASALAARLRSSDEEAGVDLAGRGQQPDLELLVAGTAFGLLPATMKAGQGEAATAVAELREILGRLEGRISRRSANHLVSSLDRAAAGDFESSTEALFLAMVAAVEGIETGSERAHGYVASGLYAGLCALWAAAGEQSVALGQLAPPLIALLEEDAVMGGADRAVARQLALVAAEVNRESPAAPPVFAAVEAMARVSPDE